MRQRTVSLLNGEEVSGEVGKNYTHELVRPTENVACRYPVHNAEPGEFSKDDFYSIWVPDSIECSLLRTLSLALGITGKDKQAIKAF